MRGHFRHLHFNSFPMTWRTPQGEMFWPLQLSSEVLGVPKDSQVPISGVWVSSSHSSKSGVATIHVFNQNYRNMTYDIYFLHGLFLNGYIFLGHITILATSKQSTIESASELYNKHMDQLTCYHEWVFHGNIYFQVGLCFNPTYSFCIYNPSLTFDGN